MRAAQRLVDDLVDQAEFLRRSAVMPMASAATSRRSALFHRIAHSPPARSPSRCCTAASAAGRRRRWRGRRPTRPRRSRADDRTRQRGTSRTELRAIASLWLRSSEPTPGIRARRVDQRDDRQLERSASLHQPQRLAIALRLRHAVVARTRSLVSRPFCWPISITGAPSRRAKRAHRGQHRPEYIRSPCSSWNP